MLPQGRNRVEGWIQPAGLVFATCGVQEQKGRGLGEGGVGCDRMGLSVWVEPSRALRFAAGEEVWAGGREEDISKSMGIGSHGAGGANETSPGGVCLGREWGPRLEESQKMFLLKVGQRKRELRKNSQRDRSGGPGGDCRAREERAWETRPAVQGNRDKQ